MKSPTPWGIRSAVSVTKFGRVGASEAAEASGLRFRVLFVVAVD